METQNQEQQQMTQEELLLAIYEDTRKTKKYMQWQFYITIALVVLPILVMSFAIPMIMKSLGSAYGATSGILQ